jgi:hypothetical protein
MTQPKAALTLYTGDVMHARLKPFVHRFAYKVFSILIDIDRLDEADTSSRLFSVDRRNVLSFRPDDFGRANNADRPKGRSLRSYVNGLLEKSGVDANGTQVTLLCYPRIFGYAFNPISVYFVRDSEDHLIAIIYEVRNTFGEMHTYVAPIMEGEATAAGIRQTRDKNFHVSPFMPMEQTYRFRIRPPDENVRLRILETDGEGPILSASFAGDAAPATSRNIISALATMGFFSFKIMAGIHWEALRLWLKGAKFRRSPPPPPAVSYPAEVKIAADNAKSHSIKGATIGVEAAE